jgi:hypothetical protein
MTVQELEGWFAGRELPKGPISPNKSIVIEDPAYFVESQFRVIGHNSNPKLQEPCTLRLVQFKEWMEVNEY